MTYSEVLQSIHSRKAFSSGGPSLARIRRLMARLGDPQNTLRCIHVAGTNGKGSVCALVESALRQSGFRVGLFTSPYLVDFRERIQIDREMISREALISCFQTVMAAESDLERQGFEPVNEFELVTALGFTAFARQQVDYAVIEVGLGGRCDATNVIDEPEVCCITPISLDHTAVLGDTLAAIAGEKAGIIKHGVPVVLARQDREALDVLERAAQGSPCIRAGEGTLLSYSLEGLRFRYDGNTISLPLLGEYQMDNAAAAWEVCKCLGLSPDAVLAGFAGVRWPGRLQYAPGPPPLLLDAGHNPAGIEALCRAIDTLVPERELITVMAMMRDKDHGQCVPMVARRSKLLIAAQIPLPRCLPPEVLAQEASPYCRTGTASSIPEGLRRALATAGPNQMVLVCGSVYAAGEALKNI